MKTLKVHLLANKKILVGEITKKSDHLRTFYVRGIERLDEFFQNDQEKKELFNKAFCYWILCELDICKESRTRYGTLIRELITYSKEIWNWIQTLTRRIAKEISQFQKVPDAWRLY